MFEIGDYIVYGKVGICEIIDITTMDLIDIPRNKLYYVLHPHHEKGRKVFTPVENKKVNMRKIMTKKEAMTLIESIPMVEALCITNEKEREEIYKKCLSSGKCKEWIQVIKSIYLRKQEKLATGKKVSATDEKYMKLAEEHLYGELSIPLEIPEQEMEQYIIDRLHFS